MVYWLTQSATDLPATNGTTVSYLSLAEQRRWQTLKTDKRRNDWLLGRWTAKRLLQSVINTHEGERVPLQAITIDNNPDGVPYCRLPLPGCAWAISISHSGGRGLVAALPARETHLGADMERIQIRPPGFAEAYFTTEELALGDRLDGRERLIWETAVWCAKEAALKALHLGLSVSTCAVSCLIQLSGQNPGTWQRFVVACDDGRLPGPAPALGGWWRATDGFVFTIVRSQSASGSYVGNRLGIGQTV